VAGREGVRVQTRPLYHGSYFRSLTLFPLLSNPTNEHQKTRAQVTPIRRGSVAVSLSLCLHLLVLSGYSLLILEHGLRLRLLVVEHGHAMLSGSCDMATFVVL
jgi:hypothetical protein